MIIHSVKKRIRPIRVPPVPVYFNIDCHKRNLRINIDFVTLAGLYSYCFSDVNIYHTGNLRYFFNIAYTFSADSDRWFIFLLFIFAFLFNNTVRGDDGGHANGLNHLYDNIDPYMVREFTVEESSVLKVFTVAGNIEVIKSTENKVRVELYVDRGYAFWSNTKNLDNYRIIMIKRMNEIVASVEKKGREASFFGDQMSFSYKIYVPESISAELKTLAGNIHLRGVSGNHAIKTSGGNIEVEDVTGHLKAYTSGGSIAIKNSRGTIFGQTEGGNINVSRGEGEMRLRTSGGRINLEQISGAALAKAGGGDIRAHFLHIAEGVSLTTSAGNIDLEVPSSEGYDLIIRGSNVNFDQRNFKGIHNSRAVEGSYKSGGIPLNLSTNSGTVSLKIKGD